MYGFRKVSRRKESFIFHHPKFVRDHPENYPLIKRANKKKDTVKKDTRENRLPEIGSLRLKDVSPNLIELLRKLFEVYSQN